jgi:FAD/FMN-containing dehydrogenase
MKGYQSWGRFPAARQEVLSLQWRSEAPKLIKNVNSLLPFGKGRSYGDVCLNDGGKILATSGLNRLIAFNPDTGVLEAESGLTLCDILTFSVPRGFFLPVTPGTRFVSLGGAIANDVHGKNHHRQGSFGEHVNSLEILRSNGEVVQCSRTKDTELFNATIGGIGLTGLILSASLNLKPIESSLIDFQSIKFSSLGEFFEISSESDKQYEYTVAWLDCLHDGASFGRGLFMRGNHAKTGGLRLRRKFAPSVPFDFPSFALNSCSVKAFNFCYYNKQLAKIKDIRGHYEPFFYPLDGVKNWNRIYGSCGFSQFQCVLPRDKGEESLKKILSIARNSQLASFLVVLKDFGERQSTGLMSFSRPGFTLCLDFPMRGDKTISLLKELDRQVAGMKGAVYPAKDATMSAENFKQYFPSYEEFKRFKDPAFSSSFWRRVSV